MGVSDDVRVISLSVGLCSLACSITTILLIRSLKKINGYLLLLFTITCFQVLYDVNYVLRITTSDSACYVGQFLDLVGGLGAAFWTNILTFSVTYTIIRCQSIRVFAHYPLFSLFGTGAPTIVAILALALQVIETDDDETGCNYNDTFSANAIYSLYYWGRLVSVIVTFALCSYNFFHLNSLLDGRTTKDTDVRTARQHDYTQMYQTIYRMNFYAIAQVISRSGAAWNEWDYGQYSCDASDILQAITSPSMGILNFFIFLIMQPLAWKTFVHYTTFGWTRDKDRQDFASHDMQDYDTGELSGADAAFRAARLASEMADSEVVNKIFMSEIAMVATPGHSLYENPELRSTYAESEVCPPPEGSIGGAGLVWKSEPSFAAEEEDRSKGPEVV